MYKQFRLWVWFPQEESTLGQMNFSMYNFYLVLMLEWNLGRNEKVRMKNSEDELSLGKLWLIAMLINHNYAIKMHGEIANIGTSVLILPKPAGQSTCWVSQAPPLITSDCKLVAWRLRWQIWDLKITAKEAELNFTLTLLWSQGHYAESN